MCAIEEITSLEARTAPFQPGFHTVCQSRGRIPDALLGIQSGFSRELSRSFRPWVRLRSNSVRQRRGGGGRAGGGVGGGGGFLKPPPPEGGSPPQQFFCAGCPLVFGEAP